MKTKFTKFILDIIRIGDWVSSCQTEEQLKIAEAHYMQVVSKARYPERSKDELTDALDHLQILTAEQIIKINQK